MQASQPREIGGTKEGEINEKRSLDITSMLVALPYFTTRSSRSSDQTLVINASNLPLRWGRPPKPFVKIEAGGVRNKTKTVVEATAQPTWNESFAFVQLPPSSIVSIRVFHDGTFHNTFLCRAAIEIDELLSSSAENSGL
ncbi:hypothetical protein BOTBODRAFT_469903 [Botryobasidium botryosum FD-172 SS1]|uniref:C2 domain-containing protein n=1 Tax=Botryobasidium botryosum (strain FD-172 SS1) TaxID=930990 RepID=A0A067M5F0_BOTB1|nr:hypothetical protein BOTBODRAFT_469903 [Botryobasidium botryosum FD-172 SS1]